MSPNEKRYFDEKWGSTFNGRCPLCDTPVWHSERLQTMYHGKEYYHNREDKIVGKVYLVEGKSAVYCDLCWYDADKKRRMFLD
jgi:hypothetical protein